jgi:hypothetical protein
LHLLGNHISRRSIEVLPQVLPDFPQGFEEAAITFGQAATHAAKGNLAYPASMIEPFDDVWWLRPQGIGQATTIPSFSFLRLPIPSSASNRDAFHHAMNSSNGKHHQSDDAFSEGNFSSSEGWICGASPATGRSTT